MLSTNIQYNCVVLLLPQYTAVGGTTLGEKMGPCIHPVITDRERQSFNCNQMEARVNLSQILKSENYNTYKRHFIISNLVAAGENDVLNN